MDIFVRYLFNYNIPISTIYLIIIFPIITSIYSFTRYVLGYKTFNLFPEIMLIFSLFSLSIIENNTFDYLKGFKIESFFIIASILFVTFAKLLFQNTKLHIIPKKNLILSSSLIGIILVFILLSILDKSSIIKVDFIIIISTIILAENYLSLSIRRNLKVSLKRLFNTLFLSYLIFFVFANPVIRNFILLNSYFGLIFIIINIFIGKYSGLRLTEVFRFKSLNV